ncbi:MAG: gamma-glutamyltransferase [Alphaproteobacteria bacterium]|nr:gamma-glutamyltransferase [Alphaproteobacteria bacterium]
MRNFEMPGRSAAYGANGMAATSHPRATLAALDTLRAGGNAVDAAVAAIAVHSVVEPAMTGIGGDCFALYAPAGGDIVAYNGSGRAAGAATTQWYLENGITEIRADSPHAVTIPGAVEAWSRLVGDHGTKELGELLTPAIDLAETGYPIQPRVAYDWARFEVKLNANEAIQRRFLNEGRLYKAGDIFKQPELAATLREIAAKGADGFYKGRVAEAMVATLNGLGGLQTVDDFANARGDYCDPISTTYRDHQVLECPPNGQGFIALIMLNILQGFDLAGLDPDSARRLHLEIEAGRLGFRERDRYFGDLNQSAALLDSCLTQDYAGHQRALIRTDRAMSRAEAATLPAQSDTVYLTVVDRDANAVSFINSLFRPFGSGLLCDETGVMFHDRGSLFVVDETSGNTIEPGKRPYHTILPGMLVRDGRADMPFGVMGGQYQPFGHVHLLTNILDYGMDVQQALEHPRLFYQNQQVEAEGGISPDAVAGLEALGHTVVPTVAPHGGGQAIWIDWDRGVFVGGSDPRKDGCALGY